MEVGLTELTIGNHDRGAAAPLPSRNGSGVYMRSGNIILNLSIGLILDEGGVGKVSGSFSFSVALVSSPSKASSRTVKGQGLPALLCSTRHAGCIHKGR